MPEPTIIHDGPEITRRVLEREQIGTYRTISRYVLTNAKFKVVEDEAVGMMVELVSEVLTERIAKETHDVSIDVPATWWQHFKLSYMNNRFMRRFIRRYPVKLRAWSKTVFFDAKRLYPNADIPKQVTPLGRPIMFETISETDWSTS